MPEKLIKSQQDIEGNLRELGLKAGDTVEVHASLSSVGQVNGGATAVTEALINVVTSSGALLMSNYPLSRPLQVSAEERDHGIAWKVRRLPEDSSESTGTGAISDNFRWREDVVCGAGIHRICAWGRGAETHVNGYEYLVEVNGLVLLMGVDIDRCSSMHLSEKVDTTEEARVRMDSIWGKSKSIPIPDDVRNQYPPDIILGEEEEGMSGDPWTNARDEADRRGLVTRGNIGCSNSMLFRIQDMLDLLENIRRYGPYVLGQD